LKRYIIDLIQLKSTPNGREITDNVFLSKASLKEKQAKKFKKINKVFLMSTMNKLVKTQKSFCSGWFICSKSTEFVVEASGVSLRAADRAQEPANSTAWYHLHAEKK
jgi:hypothetical protein